MKTRRHVPIAPGKLGAWVCLLAVILLWTPLWAMAWQADGMDCCKGGMCMAHRHSKPDADRPQQTGAEETPMDCEHHGGSGLSNCSMACCQENSQILATPAIFVMPEPATICLPSKATTAPSNFAATEFVQSFAPPSPPPRMPLLSL
ncbi:MAG: hypothetical protein ABSG77_04955 [Candidatus Acidiferrum sp.]